MMKTETIAKTTAGEPITVEAEGRVAINIGNNTAHFDSSNANKLARALRIAALKVEADALRQAALQVEGGEKR